MKILHLKEGLNKNFDFIGWESFKPNVKENDFKDKEDFKLLQNALSKLENGSNDKKLINQYITLGKKILDPENLTIGFQTFLNNRIIESKWDPNDDFIKWLFITEDENIKSLDGQAAKVLADHFDNGDLEPNSPYLIQNNNLFTEGSSKDIIYKLNALSMLLDEITAKKYKDSNGNTPTVDYMLEKPGGNKFKPTIDIKRALEGFSNNQSKEDKKLISFRDWVTKIQEWDPKQIFPNLKFIIDIFAKDKQEANYINLTVKEIFSDEKLLNDFYSGCRINKEVKFPFSLKELSNTSTKEQFKNVGISFLNQIKNYINQNKQLVAASKSQEIFLKPNSIVKMQDILIAKSGSIEKGFQEIGNRLLKLKDKNRASEYIKAFKQIWATKRFRNDFLNSNVRISSKGEAPLAKAAIDYILKIDSSQLNKEEAQ